MKMNNAFFCAKWDSALISDVVEICDTLRKPINSKERKARIAGKKQSELYPYYGATGQVGYIDDYITDGEDVLLCEDGAPFLSAFASKAYIISGKTWVNNHAHVLRSKTNNKFLCYYLNSFNYKGYVSGTTRLKLTQASMKRIPIPVPPLPEQERIVARIEELFSELDKAVETLKKTKEQLAVYRQAVLKEAFDGITKTDSIRNITSIVTSGSRGWAKYYSNNGAMFVRIGNLTRTGIDITFNDVQRVNLPEQAEGIRSRLQPNDVLISITADLGSIGLVPNNIGEAYINQHIALVRFNNLEQGKFMAWYLRSELGQKDLLKNKRGAGKLGLGLDDIRNSRVPIFTNEVAVSIVAEIESRLSVCDSIEKTIDTALQESEAMRQSILKKAFEGEQEDEDLVYNRQDFWTTSSNKQLNFVQHINTILKATGKAAVVVPDNVLFEGGAGEIVRRKLLETTDLHTILRLPTGIFYKPGVKANVIFFDKRPASPDIQTKEVWVYDFRTNVHFTLKKNPMTEADLVDFIKCYHPDNRYNRYETWSEETPEGRFRRFSIDEIMQRDKLSLDIFWLKDKSLADLEHLPPADELADDIIENLQSALESFKELKLKL